MRQRGDTIVEVLFAVTVFSLIAVGGLSIMKMDAQADALRYLHSAYITNFDNNDEPSTTKLWQDAVTKHAVTKAQAFDDDSDAQTCNLPPRAHASTNLPYGVQSDAAPFVLDIKKLDPGKGSPVIFLTQGNNIDTTATYSQIRYPIAGSSDPAKPEGMWVQAVYSPPVGGVLGYYDFHIRACWLTPGQLAPVTLGTIVRLYEPK